ncbi:MAG: response regulator [Lachnospiraceae bacterium]|nr:response regulator [Lachnospiraceae bacterium]
MVIYAVFESVKVMQLGYCIDVIPFLLLVYLIFVFLQDSKLDVRADRVFLYTLGFSCTFSFCVLVIRAMLEITTVNEEILIVVDRAEGILYYSALQCMIMFVTKFFYNEKKFNNKTVVFYNLVWVMAVALIGAAGYDTVLYALAAIMTGYICVGLFVISRQKNKATRNERYLYLVTAVYVELALVLPVILKENVRMNMLLLFACVIMYIRFGRRNFNYSTKTGGLNLYALIWQVYRKLEEETPFSLLLLELHKVTQKGKELPPEEALSVFHRTLANANRKFYIGNYFDYTEKRFIALSTLSISEFERKVTQTRNFLENTADDIRIDFGIAQLRYPEDIQGMEELMQIVPALFSKSQSKSSGEIIKAGDYNLLSGRRISELEEKVSKADEARKEAENANQTQTRFLTNMSHELKTPLNAVVGMAELIIREDASLKIKENASNIKTSANTLLSMINDILDVSKIEYRDVDLVEKEYCFSDLMKELVNVVRTRLDNRFVHLIIDVDPSVPEMLVGDVSRIRKVFKNLLDNAIKYTERGFIKLSVNAMQKDRTVTLFCSVEDTGIGIREEDREHLFELFNPASYDMDYNNTTGTGLGLAICHKELELLGGQISVDSEYGVGSNFYFSFPQTIGRNSKKVSIDKPEEYRILYMGDFPEEDRVVKKIFEYYHLAADFAEDVQELLSLVETEDYTDVFVPKNTYEKYIDQLKKAGKEGMRIYAIKEFWQSPIEDPDVVQLQKPVFYLNLVYALRNELYTVGSKNLRDSLEVVDSRVMVVDDNKVNLKVAVGLLEDYGFEVVSCNSGIECIETLQTDKAFDLIFMDHMMPEMDGVQTLQAMKSLNDEEINRIPVVAFTANALSGSESLYEKAGFCGIIFKPIDILKLEEIIKQMIPPQNIRIKKVEEPSAEIVNFRIEGVDTLMGLRQSSNSMDKYRKLLEVVCMDGMNKISVMRDYIKNKDYYSYMVEVHSLKSVAGSIGAVELSDLAKEQEMAVKDGKFEFLDSNLDHFLGIYEGVLHRISEALLADEVTEEEKAPVEQTVISGEEYENKINEIRLRIEAYEDEEAIELLHQLAEFKPDREDTVPVGKAMTEQIINHLKRFDYTTAVNMLNTRRTQDNEKDIISRR